MKMIQQLSAQVSLSSISKAIIATLALNVAAFATPAVAFEKANIASTELPEAASVHLKPEDNLRDYGQMISFLLRQVHYSHPKFDDALSIEAHKQLLKQLDPNRSYFYQADIDELNVFKDAIDNAVSNGKIELAFSFFALFEERFRERYEFALSLLDEPFDFTKNESYEYDRRESAWIGSRKEMDALWRMRIKNDALTLKLADQTDEQIRDKLTKRYRSAIRRLSQTTNDDVFGYFANAINSAIDPHSSYYTPQQFESFTINMSLKLQGIGAILTQEDQFTKVVSIVNKGPAYKTDKLHKDDKIIGVGQGDKGEIVDVIGWRNDDVVDLIRGEAGSVVRLQVIPHTEAGDGAPMVVRIVREEIKLEDQAAKADIMQVPIGDELPNGTQAHRKVGIIELPSFYTPFGEDEGSSTTEDMARLIKDLQAKQVEGIVIDLRNNGGGSLREVINMTGLFIDQGPVVQGRNSSGQVDVLKDEDGKTLYSGPLAVLVNGNSASASEIFAGAIQDYGRGLIIGEDTFGKGTVQTVADLNRYTRNPEDKAGALKLTIQKYYRITGNSTQNKGVVPDIAFPTIYDSHEYGESSFDNALSWDTIAGTQFNTAGDIQQVLPYLAQMHSERRINDKEFAFLVEDIEYSRSETEKKSLSLNYEARLAKREENKARRLARENFRRSLDGLTEIKDFSELEDIADNEAEQAEEHPDRINFKRDILLKETANILLDLVDVTKNPKLAAHSKKK